MIYKIACIILVIPITFFMGPVDSNTIRFPKSFSCPSKGRFPHPVSAECKLYYECDEDLYPVLKDCVRELFPQSNWLPVYYHRPSKKCEFGGCPEEYLTTTTSTTTTSTTTTSTTTKAPTTSKPKFSCKQNGYFPDPESCTKFHVCVVNEDDTFDYEFDCAPSTVYCPQFQVCGWERDCPCNNK